MFNMLLQLHHHRHKAQQLLSAKSISEITPPLHPPRQQQANTTACCRISSVAFHPAPGRKDSARDALLLKTRQAKFIRSVSQLTGVRCASQNCGRAALHDDGKIQHQRCARRCTLLPPNPSPSPADPRRAEARGDAQRGGRPSSSAIRLTRSPVGTNLRLLSPALTGRIPGKRRNLTSQPAARLEPEQCSVPSSTRTPPSRRGENKTQLRLKLQGGEENSQDGPPGTRTEFIPGNLCQVGLSFLPQMGKAD